MTNSLDGSQRCFWCANTSEQADFIFENIGGVLACKECAPLARVKFGEETPLASNTTDTLSQKLRYYSVDKVPRACERLMREAAEEIEHQNEWGAVVLMERDAARGQVERLRTLLREVWEENECNVDCATQLSCDLMDRVRAASSG